ncbi:GyrI-like domain-containing protein [Bacillus sp. Cs-700]|uniref:GyrI-like domain-containing protein n=1 Tax=Bacillus sp. Cs-700 TaxID=2589818 RepID=UPI00140936DA|nr:GyrI-like domain-containing protein [Bacillus sp. Cs-700]
MEFKKLERTFKVVGMKHIGEFQNYGNEVPVNAQKFMSRVGEISNHATEIALYEPKKSEDQLEGEYYVGIIVHDSIMEVPSEMEYLEVKSEFVATRGKISDVGKLHSKLGEWAKEQGYHMKQDAYMIETYHSVENGEEVEIYLPITNKLKEVI